YVRTWRLGRDTGCVSARLGRHCYSFLFDDPAYATIYTLSLHDALPISGAKIDAGVKAAGDRLIHVQRGVFHRRDHLRGGERGIGDRKSTRLNSSHLVISYAVFCLKKKNEIETNTPRVRLVALLALRRTM